MAAAISQGTLYNIFEGLTRLDGGGGVLPLLAKSWDISDDGTTYTFSLEEGVTYHNGSSFDSADVKAQFERNAAEDSSNKSKSLFASIESITTPDSHTVQIKLPSANALFPFFLVNLAPAFLGVSFRIYLLATFFGIIPATFIFAQFGTGLGSILESGDEISMGSILSGDVLAALIGLALLSALPVVYKYYQARKGGGSPE